MIAVGVAQALRSAGGLVGGEALVDGWIDAIERDFCRADLGAVLELVAPDGAVLDHFDGRLLNPGHAIEAAWFILEESRQRGNDARLTALGVRMLTGCGSAVGTPSTGASCPSSTSTAVRSSASNTT